MQIWESKSSEPIHTPDFATSDWVPTRLYSSGNLHASILNIEVEAGSRGLQVLRIGAESPLRCLRPLGGLNMQGLVESGDRIVAINGVAITGVCDLEMLLAAGRSCEITIFDHRTRLTVSWQIHVRGMLEAA